ncbi:hypothetical protein MMC13_000840 [Lambiella insularis]|nr:hypothetical protein [Lambiella insularis]
MINFSTRVLLRQYAPSLDRLQWWKALTGKKIDNNLPLRFLILAALFFGVTIIPANLWTGALTPVLVTREIVMSYSVPVYAPDLDGKFWNQTWTPTAKPSPPYRSPMGAFSYTPAYDRGGSMINTAAGIIFDKDNTTSVPRSDHTGFTYSTRSFGVGAAVGLVPLDPGDTYSQYSSFTYNETGYSTSVDCSFNASSTWIVHPPQDPVNQTETPYVPNVYMCQGSTPDNGQDWFLQYSISDDAELQDSNIVAIMAHRNHTAPNENGIVAIATGSGKYAQFNNTQCSITFTPTLCQVDVDLDASTFSVYNMSTAPDMDPTANPDATFNDWTCTNLPQAYENLNSGCQAYQAQGQVGSGNLATRALRQLVDLSTIDASLRQSALGEMFLSDLANEQLYRQLHASSALSDSDVILYSVEQGIRSILDDTLLTFASTQIMIMNATTNTSTTVPAMLTVYGVQFGTKTYIYLTFTFNALLVLCLVHEALRTRAWKHLPLFNYNDIKSVVITSSMGGKAVADEVAKAHGKKDSTWTADPKDRIGGDVRVQLRHNRDTGFPELVLAAKHGQASDVEKSPWLTTEEEQGRGLLVRQKAPYVQVGSLDEGPDVSPCGSLLETGFGRGAYTGEDDRLR